MSGQMTILVRLCPSDLTDGWSDADAAFGMAHVGDYEDRLIAALRALYPQARIRVEQTDVSPVESILVLLPDGARSARDEAVIAEADDIVWQEWLEACYAG